MLWKTTVVIWSKGKPSEGFDPIDLAREATLGAAYCSQMDIVPVERPSEDPSWDDTEFFGDRDEFDSPKDTVLLVVEEEYPAYEWWAAIRLRCEYPLGRMQQAVPDVTVEDDGESMTLRVWLLEHRMSCEISRSDREAVLSWFATFPGWIAGPAHAPNPIVVEYPDKE